MFFFTSELSLFRVFIEQVTQVNDDFLMNRQFKKFFKLLKKLETIFYLKQ